MYQCPCYTCLPLNIAQFSCLIFVYANDSLTFVFHTSLIKMVYSIAAKSGERPRWHLLEHAIRRNFGGLIEGDPVEIFKRYYQETDVS